MALAQLLARQAAGERLEPENANRGVVSLSFPGSLAVIGVEIRRQRFCGQTVSALFLVGIRLYAGCFELTQPRLEHADSLRALNQLAMTTSHISS